MVENLLHYAGEVLHQRGPGYLLSQAMLGSEQTLSCLAVPELKDVICPSRY